MYGSVRGAARKGRPYRDQNLLCAPLRRAFASRLTDKLYHGAFMAAL